MKILLIFLLFACSNCRASNDKEAIASASMIFADWATTHNMSTRYNEGFYEKGPLIKKLFGPTPNTNQVDLYFIARLALHYAVYKSDINEEYKQIYYYITFFDHGSTTANNLSLGLKFKF